MRLSRSKFGLLLLLTTACLLQGVTPLTNPEVRRIGEKVRCMCGGCNYTLTSCNMMECHGAKEGREKMMTLVEKGLSEQQILDQFVADYGTIVLTKPPSDGFNVMAWVMPPVGALLGLGFVYLFIKRMRRPVAVTAQAAAASDALLDKYRDSIEKDLQKLDE